MTRVSAVCGCLVVPFRLSSTFLKKEKVCVYVKTPDIKNRCSKTSLRKINQKDMTMSIYIPVYLAPLFKKDKTAPSSQACSMNHTPPL